MSSGTTNLYITSNDVTMLGKFLHTFQMILMMQAALVLSTSHVRVLSGDVQRTISTSEPLKGDEYFREIYLRECDRLAESLYVANYRRPEVRRYAFDRAGSEFIMAVPGPADTAVGSRIVLNQFWR